MSSQKSAADLLKEQQSHVDLLKEHKTLLDTYGEGKQHKTGLETFHRPNEEVQEHRPLVDIFANSAKSHEKSIIEGDAHRSLLDVYSRGEGLKDPHRAFLEAYARSEYKDPHRALLEAYAMREVAVVKEEREEKTETPIDLTVRGGEDKKQFE